MNRTRHLNAWQLAMVLLLFFPGLAMAACTTNRVATYSTTLPSTIKIDPHVGVGELLSTTPLTLGIGMTAQFTCTGSNPQIVDLIEPTYLGNNIYDSGIPGIGFKFYIASQVLPWSRTETSGSLTQSVSAKLELVKTGPISGVGVLEGFKGRWYLPNQQNYLTRTFTVYGGTSIVPSKPTCAVTTPELSVPMPPAILNKFNGVGSFSQEKSFSIGMNCAGGDAGGRVAIYGVLTDQNNPKNISTTLPLSAAESTASGVGVQVLMGGKLLSFGPDSSAKNALNRWSAGSHGVGSFGIPFVTRYVQTLPTITPGTAVARATFTLSYE